jgi:hypothetical protein
MIQLEIIACGLLVYKWSKKMKKIMYCLLIVAAVVANSHGDIYQDALKQIAEFRLKQQRPDPFAKFDDIIIRLPEGYDDFVSKLAAHGQQSELVTLLGKQGYDLSTMPVGMVKRDIDARIDQLLAQAEQSYRNGKPFDMLHPAYQAERLSSIRDEFTKQQAWVAHDIQQFKKDRELIQAIGPLY